MIDAILEVRCRVRGVVAELDFYDLSEIELITQPLSWKQLELEDQCGLEGGAGVWASHPGPIHRYHPHRVSQRAARPCATLPASLSWR